MKKTILFPLLILALILLACAQTVGTTQTPAAGTAQKVEVTWYVRSGNDAETKWEQNTVIPDFEAKNTNIKIKLVSVASADFDTNMQSMISSGTPPDIWSHWGPSGFQDYVKRGLVADLTPLIDRDKFDLADFVPQVLDIYKVNGKVMGLPFQTGGTYIYYNKDQFDKAGVSYPPTNWDDTNWTYSAFLDRCKALTKVTGNSKTDIFGCYLAFWPSDQYAWLWGQDLYPDSAYQTGLTNTANLNSPLAIQAFQAAQDLIWKLHYQPDPTQSNAFGYVDLFAAGHISMFLNGVGEWVYLSGAQGLNLGVAALPYGAANRKDMLYTDPWMLYSKSRHPQEAWTFLKYLASPDVQSSWTKATGAPPVRKSQMDSWYQLFPTMQPEEVKQVFEGSLKYGRESPNHLLARYDTINQVLQDPVNQILNNTKTAADVLPAANTALINALKKIQAQYQK